MMHGANMTNLKYCLIRNNFTKHALSACWNLNSLSKAELEISLFKCHAQACFQDEKLKPLFHIALDTEVGLLSILFILFKFKQNFL